ncbi:MAG: P-II family nitrogen regulator [Coriobacteriia bacterium]|nr:P-II family nitrogen regulator [Coriobacteriia bacterium]MDR2714454.1 hypothetical protein [Coriobacteriales bacterium]
MAGTKKTARTKKTTARESIKPNFSLICCVVNRGDASKTLKVAKKYGVKGGTISIGRGTANNRILDFLGLSEIRKEVVSMIVERELAHEALHGIGKDMKFHKPDHGIAFYLSVADFIGKKNELDENDKNMLEQTSNTSEVNNKMYQIIYVVVDKGRAEEVIEAANAAGARGGTIINARGAGIHEVQKLFSVEIEPEKEEVFIITSTEQKDDIVASVRERLQIDEPGNGILFVMDLDEAYGLHQESSERRP